MQIRNECTKCDGWGSIGWLFWSRTCDHCNGRGYEPPPPGPRPLPPPPPPLKGTGIHCGYCGGNLVHGDFDPDIGHFFTCQDCDRQWGVARNP
jgi:hypothetical protein